MEETKHNLYHELTVTADALTEGEENLMAILSNVAALLGDTLPQINWAGFYLMDFGQLVLGPFWGKPACLRIQPGRGVCGTAAALDAIQRVDDVHAFPGHIACDAASASEIVIPLHVNGRVAAVLDIDSPVPARFTETDQDGLARLAAVLEALPWHKCGYDLH